ncbi:protein rhiA [Corallococcus exercitus]|uniref:Protein rhiA n=1 Tax=Corallococcus exercitus TaxID=2316736 RepID=A0A7Y4KE05_9BACT|nr:protein rhiA [Corallococcus exercitus]NOK31951.1 protein rhiA [Corallococcus exercitus]
MNPQKLQVIPGIRHRLVKPANKAANTAPAGQKYSIKFINNSNNDWTFCCFQKDPTITDPTIMSLAWYTKKVVSGESVTFTWYITYNFLWASTGILQPGITFDASQVVGADLTNDNLITLTSPASEEYKFISESNAGTSGSLSIYCDNTIPDPKVVTNGAPSVGIGMSGQGTFALQAQPNTTTTFTPNPTYYITFANELSLGQVMSAEQTTSAQQVSFPGAVNLCTATLDHTNAWSLSYG